MSTWPPLERRDLRAFGRARRDVHVALQLVAAAAASYAKAEPDDAHTGTTWTPARAFRSVTIGGAQTFHVELEPATLRLAIDRPSGPAHLELVGKTFPEALGWLRERVAEHDLDDAKLAPPKHVGFALPTDGERFDATLADARDELARYFDASDAVLRAVAGDGRAPRIWPHHFDIATRISLPSAGDASVGLGMSPGDDSYDEPYWYASPWPVPPAADTLPRLGPPSSWHTKDWFGAVLLASALPRDAASQRTTVRGFFDSALDASKTLLIRSPLG